MAGAAHEAHTDNYGFRGFMLRFPYISANKEKKCPGSAQEVLTFLPCREAIKPHIQGKEYDGDWWRQGESNRSSV